MDKLKIKKIIVGHIKTNCYLLISDNQLVVVDPGDKYEKIAAEIEKLGEMGYKYILLTHGHFDHVGAVRLLKKKYGFKTALCENEKELYRDTGGQELLSGKSLTYQGDPDIWLKGGDTLGFDCEKIQVFETPGHTNGSVSYQIGKRLFSGDTLFYHSRGRTDLPTSSDKDMENSLGKLFKLSGTTKIYPGHGRETTIEEERNFFKNNHF